MFSLVQVREFFHTLLQIKLNNLHKNTVKISYLKDNQEETNSIDFLSKIYSFNDIKVM